MEGPRRASQPRKRADRRHAARLCRSQRVSLPSRGQCRNQSNDVCGVGRLKPTDDFNPGKPYETQLQWRAPEGTPRRKLLLTKPETVIAITLRGETEPGVERKARPRRPAQPRVPRKRTSVPRAEA